MKYKVKDISNIVGVSIRTLHHYDDIGLLNPDFISESGYRLYTDKNLERLQQILFFRELDFSLDEIKNILDDPNFDRKLALKLHKSLLLKKRERLDSIIKTVEETIESIDGDKKMKKENMFRGFDMKEIEEHKKKYEEEVKNRWGETNSFKESEKRTSKYNKDDWQRITIEMDSIYKKLSDNMDKNISDPIIQDMIEAWRNHITNNFYNCDLEIFRGLAIMYVEDSRFTKNIDKYKTGLAKFLSDSMIYYCDNNK